MRTSQATVVPSITVGGRTFTDLTNLIHLTAVGTGTTNIRGTFRQLGNSTWASGYQVPVGRTLRIYAIRMINSAPGTANTCNLYQSDNDVGIESSTAFTNGVQKDAGQYLATSNEGGNSNGWERPVNITVAAQKYLSMQVGAIATSVRVDVFGYLE